MRSKDRGGSIPTTIRPLFESIVGLTDEVCRHHLNEEYAQLCRELAGVLARKRPSPLTRGRVQTWACGIAYTLGAVNFLFDPAQQPHVRAADLCALLAVSQSSGAAKSREIRRLLNIAQLDPRWCLPSKLADNPLAWMVEVDGFVVDARRLPRALQEEAYRRGLIPFVPE